MTEPTTTETPVSATQLAAAHEDFTKAETWLREAPEWHHERRVWTERKIAADSIIRRAAQARPPAAPTMTAEQRAAAITARRQTHAAMLDETEGSEMSRALLDVAVEQSNALHAGDPLPGAFTAQDEDRALVEAGFATETDRYQVTQALRTLGAGHLDGVQFAQAIRDATAREPLLSEEDRILRWSEWWPSAEEYDRHADAFAAVWNKLPEPAQRFLMAFRGDRGVVERIARFGQRGRR